MSINKRNGDDLMTTKKKTKWNTEKFKSEVSKRSSGKFTVLGEYITYGERIDTRCGKCGNTFGLEPRGFLLQGKGCPYCAGVAGRDTAWLIAKTKETVGDEFTFLDDYKGSTVKHRIRHNTCGHIIERTPSQFFSRPVHAKCPETFRQRVRDLVGDEYVFIEEYTGSHNAITVKHMKCGREYRIQPSLFLGGHKCRCTTELKSFYDSYEDNLGTDYELLGGLDDFEYLTDVLHIKHLKCGTEFSAKASTLTVAYKTSRCPECRPTKRKTTEEFKEDINYKSNDSFEVLSGYTNRESRICFRHKKCGEVFVSRARDMAQDPKCPNCESVLNRLGRIHEKFSADFLIGHLDETIVTNAPIIHKKCGHAFAVDLTNFKGRCVNCSAHKAENYFKSKVLEKLGSEYSFIKFTHRPELSEGYRRGVVVEHFNCGHVYETSYSTILEGSKCPNCVFSRGEKEVADVLDSLSIEYTREHSFEYLGRKRFDFFIPSLNIAIEYDGEQHYKSIDAWGGEEYLESVRQSDALKNDFCEYMGIDLLRIPYWEFDNIDEIVTNFIDTVKLMRSISASGSEMSKCR